MHLTSYNQPTPNHEAILQTTYQKIAAKQYVRHHDAEDAAANGVLALLEREESPENPLAFVIRSASNKAVDHVRAEVLERTLPLNKEIPHEADANLDPAVIAQARERRELIRSVLFSLDTTDIVYLVAAACRISNKDLEAPFKVLRATPTYHMRNRALEKAKVLLGQLEF